MRRAPWLHAGSAFVAGAALAAAGPTVAIPALFGAPWTVLGLVALTAAVFGALGTAFLRRPAGWWAAATVLLWVPSVIWGFAVGLGPDLDPTRLVWQALLAGGVAAAIGAVLVHRGPPRWIGVLVAIGAVAAFATVSWNAQRAADVVRGQQQLGSRLRPEVVSVPGYAQLHDATIAGDGSDTLVNTYYRPDGSPVPAVGFEFAVVTSSSSTPVCGPPLLRVGANVTSEPERSCVRVAGGWERRSADGIEFTRRANGKVVRLLASSEGSMDLLQAAARTARPMDDRYYRHLLLGEQGEYIPELDGAR